MANLSKYSATEGLNLEVGMDWNPTTLSNASEDTGHIDVTGYHKIAFALDGDGTSGYNYFKFTTGSGDDISTSDEDIVQVPARVLYEFPIPTMLGGVKRQITDTLYFHIYNDNDAASEDIYYNLT